MKNTMILCPKCKRYLLPFTDAGTNTTTWNCKGCKVTVTESQAEKPNDKKVCFAVGRMG